MRPGTDSDGRIAVCTLETAAQYEKYCYDCKEMYGDRCAIIYPTGSAIISIDDVKNKRYNLTKEK